MNTYRKTTGILLLVTCCALAPLIPFMVLWVFPVAAVFFGVIAPALVVAILLDAFLAPGGFPALFSLTVIVLCSLPVYVVFRYVTKL